MPNLDAYRRMIGSRGSNTIGRYHKEMSDIVMESTWDNDIQSQKVYIYDYLHDDQPGLCEGMTYDDTTKICLDAKFIVYQHGSISSDQVEFHLQFKPSQSVRFESDDELYWYETDYVKRYEMRFPIGLYCDIADEKGIYHKWLIVSAEQGNQFIKYSVLPCNYHLQWVEPSGNQRIKRQMWCVTRGANSYIKVCVL